MSKTLTLKYPTVASKKYIKRYQEYKNIIPPPPIPLIGCIYQVKTADNLNIIGMLMEYGDIKSIIKDKRGISFNVLTDTLKSIQ